MQAQAHARGIANPRAAQGCSLRQLMRKMVAPMLNKAAGVTGKNAMKVHNKAKVNEMDYSLLQARMANGNAGPQLQDEASDAEGLQSVGGSGPAGHMLSC